jgi:ATP-dependent DNA helicase RecG
MAPTELLAEQHFSNFAGWFDALGIQVGWLTGKVKGKARSRVLEGMADGSLQVVIGTHALFQDDVAFRQLGLVVIDEQHRFGVHQRLALRDKGRTQKKVPHQLIMTATPIPRTLSMTLYADLDTSVIDELPPGRTPVQTVVLSEQRRDEIIQRVREAGRSTGSVP